MSSKKSLPRGTQAAQARLRILAGPNGSGKSTIKGELKPAWIGAFINADEIEKALKLSGGELDLGSVGITRAAADVLGRFESPSRP